MAVNIENLKMVCHSTATTFRYHGFIVRQGNYFGIAVWDGEKVPVFWSGWTVEKCIRLYNCRTGEAVWVGDDDVSGWNIITNEDWSIVEDGEIPFFVWYRQEQERVEMIG